MYAEGELVSTPSWPGRPAAGSCSARSATDDAWALQPGAFGAYVVTDEPEALYRRAVEAGAEIVRELYTTDYGSRDFTVRDPEGNLWAFGTYRGEPPRPAAPGKPDRSA